MINFTATTYEGNTHTYVIQILTSMDCKFQYRLAQTEQAYSVFQVIGDVTVFERLRDLVQENSVYAVTLEYGHL
jgi:hypothetical protein